MNSSLFQILTDVIAEFWTQAEQNPTPRALSFEKVPGKAAVFLGARRSGKSTFLMQQAQNLLAGGVSKTDILFVNFFDDRLESLRKGGISKILDAYYLLHPEKKNTKTLYCFFDEIQMMDNWESFVDRILRTEKCEIYLSGSSARMLSSEIATQMRGRSISWEVFPFSFAEFLKHQGFKSDRILDAKQKFTAQKQFGEYFEQGGFAEVINMTKQIRMKIHQEYLNTLMFRDVIERNNISHPKAAVDLAYWFLNNCSSLFSVNSISGYLKSLGHKISKSLVAEYVEMFHDAYFLFPVKIFDASLARQNANSRKIYCVDHSFAVSCSSQLLQNTGHQLENIVFISIRRLTKIVHYYRTKSGLEIDFIFRSALEHGPWKLLQVCESMQNPSTRKRELRALTEAMAEQKVTDSIIVTLSEEEDIETEHGTINVIPVWKWLLRVGL